jgi:putative heme degradation protein
MIEAIADAKLRRMERELELHGIRFDQANESWVVRKPRSTDR